jgi:hypothetical protein
VQKYEGRPFVLLGVDEDTDDRAKLQKAEKKHELNWRSWWDQGGSIGRRWDVDALPTFFLIDHKGMTRWRSFNGVDLKEMQGLIERLVREAETESGKRVALNRDR